MDKGMYEKFFVVLLFDCVEMEDVKIVEKIV